MLRRRVLRAFGSVVVASSLATPSVSAGDASSDAKELFARARVLRLDGDCAEALPLFRQAYGVYPAGLGSLRNTAECEEALGHLAAARRAWLDLQRALLTNGESKYEGWGEDAAQAATRLAPRLGTLIIGVRALPAPGSEASAKDIQVVVNGERLALTLVGTPLERDPGHYVVGAVDADGRPVAREREFDLAAGDERRVELQGTAAASPDRVRATSGPPTATLRAVAWTVAGLGAASLLGAGIAEAERQSALTDRNNFLRNCSGSTAAPGCTSQEARSINDRGNTAATWVNVLLAAGVVGMTGGVVLFAVKPSRRARTGLVVTPSGCSVAGEF